MSDRHKSRSHKRCSEFDFLRILKAQADANKHSSRALVGIGDDGAVIEESAHRDLVITTDLLVEGVDFKRNSIDMLGWKSLAVSLSDIAAMGGRPLWSLVSLGMPKETWGGFSFDFFEAYFALANRYAVTLVGGDISESKESIVVDSIVAGETSSGGAILRSTARAGDQIFVTGYLGGAAAGLKLLEMGARLGGDSPRHSGPSSQSQQGDPLNDASNSERWAINELLLRQTRPCPRVGWGMVLGEEQLATSMIDISDGLSSDLRHLCEASGVGALLQSDAIPTDKDVKRLCGRRALDPLALALHGGEDFELLFTVAPENASRLPKRVDGVPVSRIGEITNAAGSIRVREKNHEWDLPPQGFQHFSD